MWIFSPVIAQVHQEKYNKRTFGTTWEDISSKLSRWIIKITYVDTSLYVTNYKDGMQNTNAHDADRERDPLKLGVYNLWIRRIHLIEPKGP
jgi:hypothetical protein